jgi:hypothetical protein
MPTPGGATSVEADGVSCPSATACFAVGRTFSGGVDTMFIERWDGSSWSIDSVPAPAGTSRSVLLGISCTSATACTAAGGWKDSSLFQRTLVERWNGTTWAIQTTPNPTGSLATVFEDVSCSTATSCVGVGDYVNSSNVLVTLAEAWNGTAWTVQSTPNPAGSTANQLMAVSCVSASACESTGWSDTLSGMRTLAEVGP